jgi:thymidylate synthase ThyX
MSATAKVIEHSVSEAGKELVTLQLRYQRFVHAEFMTHRMFSRNASSSRAIPVAKMIDQVRNDPAMPVHWGKNQAGMQAREELDPVAKTFVMQEWRKAPTSRSSTASSSRSSGSPSS